MKIEDSPHDFIPLTWYACEVVHWGETIGYVMDWQSLKHYSLSLRDICFINDRFPADEIDLFFNVWRRRFNL